jgi:hypothetical protein
MADETDTTDNTKLYIIGSCSCCCCCIIILLIIFVIIYINYGKKIQHMVGGDSNSFINKLLGGC